MLIKMEPQPPKGIKYLLGNESWRAEKDRTPLRLCCEEWGSLGPMELNPEILPNKAGFRVRQTEILAPEGVTGFIFKDGIYYWQAATTPAPAPAAGSEPQGRSE